MLMAYNVASSKLGFHQDFARRLEHSVKSMIFALETEQPQEAVGVEYTLVLIKKHEEEENLQNTAFYDRT